MEHEKDPSSHSQKQSEPQGLLYILLSVFAFFSGWLLSKSEPPNNESGEAVSPQDDARQEKQRRQSEPTLIPQVAPAPKQTEHAERRKRHTPLWKKLVESSVAIATVGLLIVNFFSLAATKKAADAAKRSADIAYDTLQVSQAADVTVGKKDGTVAEFVRPKNPKDSTGLVIYFQNLGHLTARFHWGSVMVAGIPPDQDIPTLKSQEWAPLLRYRNRKNGSISEGGGMGGAIGGDSYQTVSVVNLTQSAMNAMDKIDKSNIPHVFLISGIFEFCDALGTHQTKTFQIFYQGAPYNRFNLGDIHIKGNYPVSSLPLPSPDDELLFPCQTYKEQRENEKNAQK